MKKVTVGQKEYTLYTSYQQDDKLRKAFNNLTNEVWGFDFENYYQSNYWDDKCILYSLFDEDEIVSHLTISLFETQVNEKVLHLAQFGTVMTSPKYQNKGLARYLMEYVKNIYDNKVDGYFLFANDSVLNFYPKFGFTAVKEYQAYKETKYVTSPYSYRKLDLTNKIDLDLFERYIITAHTNNAFDTKNKGITMFYTYANPDFGFSDCIYYIEELNTVIIASIEEEILTVYGIYQEVESDIEEALEAILLPTVKVINFGYSPLKMIVKTREYKEDDLVLFVSNNLEYLFNNHKLMIPILSHT